MSTVIKTYQNASGAVIYINWDTCEGCGDCANVCPTNVFFIRDGKCTAPDIEFCMQCEACFTICKNGALSWAR